ncbi:MAG: acyl carrier protein [Solirubrobacteraceae bacterium]
MTEVDDRLRGCFAAAFPELSPAQILSADVDTVGEWDSLRAVVLVALLEEAFAIRIPARDYTRLRSYAAVSDYLRTTAGAPP